MTDSSAPSTRSFLVTEAQFEQMFPDRNPFYTYVGLVEATEAYPEFTTTGGPEIEAREAAAFLANISHESAGLKYVSEINTSLYSNYCDPSQPYGCPAGVDAYYGKGPIQLSWNFNYKIAGDALGIDLLNNPHLIETDATVAWKTALWYWNTQPGPATKPCHEAITGDDGFAGTIRAINGPLECEGGMPHQVENRIALFKQYAEILGTTTGDNLSC